MSQADPTNDALPPRAPWSRWLAVSAAGLLAAYPPLDVMLRGGLPGILNSIAGDSYLYMSIARYSLDKPFFTFDGTHPTNGFHPLWQYTLGQVFRLVSTREGQLVLTYALSTLFLSVGAAFAAAAVHRFTRSLLLSLLIVPGAYYALIGAQFHSQSLWSFADGMESAFSVFWGGMFFYVLASGLAEPAPRSSAALLGRPTLFRNLGLVLAPLVLSRLDDVFLVVSLGLVVLLLEGSLRDKIRAVLWIGAPTGIALAAFLTYNALAVGIAMPLSGATKSGIALPAALLMALTTVLPATIDLKSFLVDPSDPLVFYENEFRALMVLVPMAVAIVYAFVVLRHKRDQVAYLLPLGVALHLVIKGLYNLVYVNPWHQGPWYYAFSVVATTMLLTWLLRDAVRLLERRRDVAAVLVGSWIAYALVTGGQHVQERTLRESDKEGAFAGRLGIERALRAAGVSGVVNFDDGITRFLFDLPAMHGWAFATDVEAYEAYKRGAFLHLARARGHDVLTSLDYFPIEHVLVTSDEIREHFRSGPFPTELRAELDQYDFEPVYQDAALHFGFYRIVPRGQAVIGAQVIGP